MMREGDSHHCATSATEVDSWIAEVDSWIAQVDSWIAEVDSWSLALSVASELQLALSCMS